MVRNLDAVLSAIVGRTARRTRCALLAVLCAPVVAMAQQPLVDAPVAWYDDDMRDTPRLRVRDPNVIKDYFGMIVSEPLGKAGYPPRLIRHLDAIFGDGDHVLPAANVNALDEVPNNSWFTNRLGLFPMTPDEAARGRGPGRGPQGGAPWTVVAAKREGFSVGFTIRDANGDHFIVKFDPRGFQGTTTAAGAIAARLFHAAGYNVPDDNVFWFRRDQLALGDSVIIKVNNKARFMTVTDLDSLLARVDVQADGRYRALASRFLEGRPIGPFDYRGKRRDDPNDRVRHEDRRELRGLRVFAAWVSHFDTKQHNTLDVQVEEEGRRFVRHHLIDLASTLGTGVFGPVARETHEYILAPSAVVGRVATLGLHEADWRKMRRPEGLDEVGYFSAEHFDPRGFRSNFRNAAFVNMTDRDAYWAAKIVTAFTDEHLRAIVAEGHYRDPRAADYVFDVLAKRRDIIGRTFFDRIAPLEYFSFQAGSVQFRDLGMERRIYTSPTRYRARFGACDSQRNVPNWSSWVELASQSVDASAERTSSELPFLAVELQVDRGRGWSRSVTAYVAPASGRIVAVER